MLYTFTLYQEDSIQEIADFLEIVYISTAGARVKEDIIIFAGVHFMAETASINPKRKCSFDLKAGCSLADSCSPNDFAIFKAKYPDAVVVSYINCSAEIKTLSDLVCTSTNAKKIIESIPLKKEIIFAPDKNLGAYLSKETGRKMILWEGSCVVHEAFSFDKILDLIKKYPNAKFIAHPESKSTILEIANFIGSTSALLNFVQNDNASQYIVATEVGILHQMQKHCPENYLFLHLSTMTPVRSECAYMKLNTLEKLYNCLVNEKPEIKMNTDILNAARLPIERMLEIS